jgi:hypothetical protein
MARSVRHGLGNHSTYMKDSARAIPRRRDAGFFRDFIDCDSWGFTAVLVHDSLQSVAVAMQ